MNLTKKYEPAIDLLRIFSILAVVLIHSTTRTLEVSNFDIQNNIFTFLLNQTSRFAVPLFFIISGFVLELNYHLNESYIHYSKKRIGRILVPYLLWSLIYYFFVFDENRNPNLLMSILRGDASYQLYFIPTLLIFYLFFPLIHKYIRLIGNKFVIISLFVLQLFILNYDYNVDPLEYFYPLTIALLNFFPFLLGIFVANNYDNFKKFIFKCKTIFLVGTMASAFIVFKEGLNGYLLTHDYLKFYSQWRPSILIYTIFIGGFCFLFFSKKLFNDVVVKKISSLSFFVFLTHIIVLEGVTYFLPEIIKMDLLFLAVVSSTSFFVAFIVHKIPNLSKITG